MQVRPRAERIEISRRMAGRKQSRAEQDCEHAIRMTGERYIPQFTLTGYRFYDFCIPKLRLIIELDGRQHLLPRKQVIDSSKEREAHICGYEVERIPLHHGTRSIYNRTKQIISSYRILHRRMLESDHDHA